VFFAIPFLDGFLGRFFVFFGFSGVLDFSGVVDFLGDLGALP
jgi:hypothetical protein